MVEVDSASTSALHIVLNIGASVTLLKCRLCSRFHKNLHSPKWFSPCHSSSLLSSSPPPATPASVSPCTTGLPPPSSLCTCHFSSLKCSSPFLLSAFAQKLSQGGHPWSPYEKTAECLKPQPLFLLYFPHNSAPSNTLQTLLIYFVDCTMAH